VKTQRQTRRPILAGFCLVAVVLMYAPFVAFAYSARTMSCCTGDQCPIREHHHQATPPASNDAMDCGHDMSGMKGMSGMTACTMSCCHQSDRPLLTPIAFVLPELVPTSAPNAATLPVAVRKQNDFPRAIEPLSPPPRFSSAAL